MMRAITEPPSEVVNDENYKTNIDMELSLTDDTSGAAEAKTSLSNPFPRQITILLNNNKK